MKFPSDFRTNWTFYIHFSPLETIFSKVRLGTERSESTKTGDNPSVSAYLCFDSANRSCIRGMGETLKANNIWSTVCETNSRSTHRWGQNYLSGDAEYSIEKTTDFLLPEAMSHPEYKRQQVIVTALARSTRRLRRVTSRSHHAQGSIRFREARVSLSALKPEEAYKFI